MEYFTRCHFIRNGMAATTAALLAPSPEMVIDATEKYRRLLDDFPSKYVTALNEYAKI